MNTPNYSRIFLVTTSKGYWGRGHTLALALNNAKADFEHECFIDVFVKDDGADFTADEKQQITSTGLNVSYPKGCTRTSLGSFTVNELACVANADKIGSYFMNNHCEKMEYADAVKIEKMLEKLDITIL